MLISCLDNFFMKWKTNFKEQKLSLITIFKFKNQ